MSIKELIRISRRKRQREPTRIIEFFPVIERNSSTSSFLPYNFSSSAIINRSYTCISSLTNIVNLIQIDIKEEGITANKKDKLEYQNNINRKRQLRIEED